MSTVVYPDNSCTSTTKHHYIVVANKVWWCKYCWKSKWQPGSTNEAMQFQQSIIKKGLDRAYTEVVNGQSKTKNMLIRLEEIRLLHNAMPDKKQILLDIIKHITMPEAESNGRRRIAINELELLLSLEDKVSIKIYGGKHYARKR